MENPQSKQTYLKLDKNIEKWTGVFYFIGVKVTLASTLVSPFISVYLYFTNDLGTEAFGLPFPIWCVL